MLNFGAIWGSMYLYPLSIPFLLEYLNFFPALMFLNFYDFKPRIILKLFLNTDGLTSPKNLRNTFQSLLMLYFIIKLSRSLYFVSIVQKYI